MLKERNVITTDTQLAITNPFLIGTTSSTRRMKSSTLFPFTTQSLPTSLELCKVQKKPRYARAQRAEEYRPGPSLL